jgi:sugar lactone lactonase YvrE
MFYFSDVANAAVFFREQPTVDGKNPEMQILIKDYEGLPLKGPCSIYMNYEENCLYVCDSGYFGSTSLNTSTGSLFIVDLDSKISRPLLLNCLSYPSDIVYDSQSKITYMVETFTNRIIRLVQSPPDVYHSSVFHQFSGRVGPTSIAIDELGNIYVARYEFQNIEKEIDGLISVLNREGNLVGELIVPKLPEITGLCIPSGQKADTLFLTEKNSNAVFKIKLSQFALEIDNLRK